MKPPKILSGFLVLDASEFVAATADISSYLEDRRNEIVADGIAAGCFSHPGASPRAELYWKLKRLKARMGHLEREIQNADTA